MRLRKNGKYEFLIVLAGAFLYVFMLLVFSGTLTSGYHLADDHEIVLINKRFQDGTYGWNTIFQKGILGYFNKDIRFRPFYLTMRMLCIYLLGTNYLVWSIWVGMEIVLSIVVAYYIARGLGANFIFAGLVALLIVTGEQGEIWWRLGPQEPLGLVLCLICMWLIQKFEKEPKIIHGIMIVGTAFLMAASKESFTLLLPAMIFFCIGYDFWINSYTAWKERIRVSFNKNKWIILGLCINFCINMYVIIFRIGLLSIEYAGIDVKQGIKGYIGMLGRMLTKKSMLNYVFLFIVSCFLATVLAKGKKKEDISIFLKRSSILIFSLLLIVAVEMVLYAKSGMFGRYFVPFTVGISFLIAIVSILLKKKVYKYFFAMILLLMNVYLYYNAWNTGVYFSTQGKELAEGFEIIESEFEPKQKIVTCMDWGGEYDYSFTHYARIQMKMENIYTWNEKMGFYSLYEENEENISSLSEADCLILPQEMTLEKMGLPEKEYEFLLYNGYGNVYKKIKS